MTGWQLWVAREYKADSDVQQRVLEELMRAQLKTVEDLNQQVAEEGKALRAALAARQPKPAAAVSGLEVSDLPLSGARRSK